MCAAQKCRHGDGGRGQVEESATRELHVVLSMSERGRLKTGEGDDNKDLNPKKSRFSGKIAINQWSLRGSAARLATAGRRYRQAVGGIFIKFVAQRADRDTQHIGGMGAIAEAMLERLQDEVALDLGHSAADKSARHLLRGERGVSDGGRGSLLVEPDTVGAED